MIQCEQCSMLVYMIQHLRTCRIQHFHTSVCLVGDSKVYNHMLRKRYVEKSTDCSKTIVFLLSQGKRNFVVFLVVVFCVEDIRYCAVVNSVNGVFTFAGGYLAVVFSIADSFWVVNVWFRLSSKWHR